ncbi:LacI family DNA-binding transcriptional regulator [Streptomyces europaeiscabiei]|uniref:LacI family DNA-binding transcriptional regulator n=1 Tax=Streptomyces europaeiscabiei TaxID=146819 RepID=A0ABU4N6F4_9ACTN|nr:LacI family DNA-binding transcriptional regulator [Streptomyces europaeiscabiei]MDX2523529.1 LacI family DNA-binding transcriptional regulator [Streptomyces europaeiscabiei]MDX2758067.1 LacI family DNA-binding transcriptional regulator [Streptomyces europaeiscabiei]MDX2768601.1 LacI family DNA-binding transcriptional regulator [Streptomyces europaeiscabiei]MDX3541841.1 LacI family DNA-binding transcriptional regulator [Streptomyces europaeiscabiei]MDX3550835.1 LacI family DNA-binding transc
MGSTIADVAARAGVSKTTVSRVLNGKGEIHENTVLKVRKAISELGYVPSAGAVGLARGTTQMIGMLVPDLAWVWSGIVQAVVDTLESESFGLRMLTWNRGEESLRRLGLQVAAKSFDGLLVLEPEGALGYITELHESGLPVVLIDDRFQRPGFPYVTTTNREGGEQAARHLLEIGRRRPLVVTGPEAYGCTRERLGGFVDVYAQAGIELDQRRIICGDFQFENSRSAVAQALADGVEFDAVFGHNDPSAAGVLAALHGAGLEIPRDVAVVGFDDVELASYTYPALTTIRQPMWEMGEAAARLLLDHVRGSPEAAPSRTIPTSLVIRGSSFQPNLN